MVLTPDKKSNPLAAEDTGKTWQFVPYKPDEGASFVKFMTPGSDKIAEAVEHPSEEAVMDLFAKLDDQNAFVAIRAYQALEKIAKMKGAEYQAVREKAKLALAAHQRKHSPVKHPEFVPVKRGNGMFARGRW